MPEVLQPVERLAPARGARSPARADGETPLPSAERCVFTPTEDLACEISTCTQTAILIHLLSCGCPRHPGVCVSLEGLIWPPSNESDFKSTKNGPNLGKQGQLKGLGGAAESGLEHSSTGIALQGGEGCWKVSPITQPLVAADTPVQMGCLNGQEGASRAHWRQLLLGAAVRQRNGISSGCVGDVSLQTAPVVTAWNIPRCGWWAALTRPPPSSWGLLKEEMGGGGNPRLNQK